MASSYPGALDNLPTDVGPNTKEDAPGLEHDVLHNRVNEAVNAIQALLGTGSVAATVLARLAALEAGGGGGGGGAMTLVGEVVVAAAQTDIDFTGLDLEADKQYQIELFLVPNATGVQQAVRLQFNGDTTAANYRRRRITASSTNSVSSAAASDEAIVTATGGNTGQLAQPQKTTISIAKVPGVYPVADARTAGWSGTGQMWVEQTSVSRLDTANVTSIKLHHETANGFGVGTTARLYRLGGGA